MAKQDGASAGEFAGARRLFPANLLHAGWQAFPAQGFRVPVTGVIYRGKPQPTCGMPLGGIDTGCIDIEPNGLLGYSTIFNHLINPRQILNLPFLGLHTAGTTWVLATGPNGKADTPRPAALSILFPPADYSPRSAGTGLAGVQFVRSIDYWGHYPILDMEFDTGAPLEVGLRAWSPFLPGDTAGSMVPAAVFDLILRNPRDHRQSGTLAFSWPGFERSPADGAGQSVRREALAGPFSGCWVESGQAGSPWEMEYALVAAGDAVVRSGGPLNASGDAWNRIADRLPSFEPGETGCALALDFDLGPGESRDFRVILAWYAPYWRAGGAPAHEETACYHHMYAARFSGARAVAHHVAAAADGLLERIIAWQEAIYSDADTPGWLADSLINILHLVTETSVWGQAQAPVGEWCRTEDGLFGLCECPRGCPQIECLPCSFYGNAPLVYFFPEAALSTLRGYKAYQFTDGRPPWVFGGVTAGDPANQAPYELARPDRGYQTVLNGACYIAMADRYWQVTGDPDFLPEFWESLKRCNDFSMNLRPAYGLSQVVSMPAPHTDTYGLGDTEWFEAPEPGWKGYVTHAGGVRLAQLQIIRRMAQAMSDHDYLMQIDRWIAAGARALEEHLWHGEYYLNFNEPETGAQSDLVFGYQLDGQWITHWHGLPGAFPADRVQKTLATIRRINCALSQSGAVNYANPDGTPAQVGGYGPYSYFQAELFMLASTFMYSGQPAFGLELLKRCMENIVSWGYVWDFPNMTRGDQDTGERAFGADYYQGMMLWAVPAAIKGQDLSQISRPCGLVQQIIARAASGEDGNNKFQ